MHQIDPDIELVERLQAADVEAFDLLYAKYAVKLYTFGLKYLKSADETEDLIQSVFMKIWENHKHLNKDLSFKAFLFTIAYNDLCKLFRRRNYQRKFIADILYENALTSSQTEDGINYKSSLTRIQQIVDKLPRRQKEIFIKSRQEGKTTKEIAAEIGLSPGTIDNYISDSIKFIRKRMCKEDIAILLFLALFLS